jgi:hypothetical protein
MLLSKARLEMKMIMQYTSALTETCQQGSASNVICEHCQFTSLEDFMSCKYNQ